MPTPKPRRALLALACASLAALPIAPAAAAGPDPGPPVQDGQGVVGVNENSPHNLGYCAPLLGGGGLGVRDWINQVLVDPGVRSPGDLYRLRASNPDDRQCLPRSGPPPA
jgi:hypothetical protein